MIRELTSFFVSVFCFMYVWQIVLFATDPSAYRSYMGLLRNPAVVLFSIVALGFTLYHSLTWFYLIGKVAPLKVGRRVTTPLQALVVNSVIMVVVSYAVITVLLG